MTSKDERDTVSTTITSLEFIEHIRNHNGRSLKQLASDTDLSISTVHRHLVTLEQLGYVQRYGETFYLGLKFVDIGEYVRSQWPLDAINNVVSNLAEQTEEEIDFFTVDRGRIISLVSRHQKYHDALNYRENSRGYYSRYYQMHTMAAGKALLAEYPQAQIGAIVDKWGLPAKTENTITTKSKLLNEIEAIREQGYAVDDEEYASGLRTVGKVVHTPNGGLFGALNVAGPKYRMDGVVLSDEIPSSLEQATIELENMITDRDLFVYQLALRSDQRRIG